MGASVRRAAQSGSSGWAGCGVVAAIGLPAFLVLGVAANGHGGIAFLMLLAFTGVGVAIGRDQARRTSEFKRVRAMQSMEIARYHAMDPREFEHAIAYLCRRDGCHQVQVVGGAGDLGADVVAVSPDGRRIVIQCKRYGPTTKVGSPDLQRFGGTCYSVHGAQVAAIVTTSVFTRPAADYGVRLGIRLFDLGALAGWATRTGPAPWM
ncbi:restriction endonuclease [Streptomyces sp. NPDC047081]|uniref:restriction endonuclease n=1 Tax=Streptomyces sp. NPDC047081 TaxID=3154706 RepID=UPI0033F4C3DA